MEVLEEVDFEGSGALGGVEVTGVTADSRQVRPGSLFVAVAGDTVDGHCFIPEAIARGCAAVLTEQGRGVDHDRRQPPCIAVDDTRAALGRVAAAFYGHPARQMRLVGITGTNGKTTSAYLIEAMVRQAGGNPGVIGTVNYRYNGIELPAPLTTPEPVMLHGLLREMADGGVTHVIMEVSSHSLAQKRLEGLRFDVALFTNLSRDHLDFHGDMNTYFASKKGLFLRYLKEGGQAVVVTSSGKGKQSGAGRDWGRRLAAEIAGGRAGGNSGGDDAGVITCGINEGQVAVTRSDDGLRGMAAEIRTPRAVFEIHSPLVGGFNLRNLVGVAGVGEALGFDSEVVRQGLEAAGGVPGRLERVPVRPGIEVFVDYAHTPDALENVLATLREVTPARLIVLFGCGGDRDRGKRPLMGRTAGLLADIVLVTDDNPRTESPARILADIEAGLRAVDFPRQRVEILLRRTGAKGYDIIPSRRRAIEMAVRRARPGDVVLLAGKGHECYQLTREGRIFFDDRLEAARQRQVIDW